MVIITHYGEQARELVALEARQAAEIPQSTTPGASRRPASGGAVVGAGRPATAEAIGQEVARLACDAAVRAAVPGSSGLMMGAAGGDPLEAGFGAYCSAHGLHPEESSSSGEEEGSRGGEGGVGSGLRGGRQVEAEPFLEATDAYGQTAVELAVELGESRFLLTLLQCGAEAPPFLLHTLAQQREAIPPVVATGGEREGQGEEASPLPSGVMEGIVACLAKRNAAVVAGEGGNKSRTDKNNKPHKNMLVEGGATAAAAGEDELGGPEIEYDDNGDSPLHIAAREGHVGLIRALMPHWGGVGGAGGLLYPSRRPNALGLVPLHIAAMEGQDQSLLALLHGCAPEVVRAKTPDGRTALHLLASGLARPGSVAMGCSSAVEELERIVLARDRGGMVDPAAIMMAGTEETIQR